MRTRAIVLMMAIVGALATGCGSSDEPGVASAGGAKPQASSTSIPAADRDEQLRQFAQCMREQGVDVADPQPGGNATQMGAGLDLNDPAVQAAFTACQDKLPGGGQPPKLNPEQAETYRAFAACMREQGVDLPDPGPDGQLQLGGTLLGSLNDPAFQAALTACRDTLTGLRASAGTGS